jgi:ketosteroid isomerase-like protein
MVRGLGLPQLTVGVLRRSVSSDRSLHRTPEQRPQREAPAMTGIELNAEFVHVWRFGPDGKIAGLRIYTDTHLWRQALGVD